MLRVYENDTEERERKERINEIIDCKNKQQRQKYVDEIIAPAYHYFRAKNEINNYQAENDNGCFAYLILFLPTLVYMGFELLKLGVSEYILLCMVIALIPCIIGDWIIYLIYKRTPLTIKHFELDLDVLAKGFEHTYNYYRENGKLEFTISKESFVNNCIIEQHNKYLCSIKQTVVLRSTIRKMIGILAAFVFCCGIPIGD